MNASAWRGMLAAPLVAMLWPFAGPSTAAESQAPPHDAVEWLQRLYLATKKLSYSGTFVYQHGTASETSRVTRIVDANGVQERIEVLDGSPREIVRNGDELRAYLPDSMTVKIERAAGDRPFLPILPTRVQELASVYEIRKGGIARIAGFDCQAISLIPRDNMRYGHRFWADLNTGMLLKAQTYDEHKEVVEQFVFTQLKIGAGVQRADLRSRFRGDNREWRIEETHASAPGEAELPWIVRAAPAGFRKLVEMRRTFAGNIEVSHIVMSDGLASVSIFIESATRGKPNPPPLGASRQGAINVFTRKLDAHLVTAVGEAPAACVEAIAKGLETRTNAVAKP